MPHSPATPSQAHDTSWLRELLKRAQPVDPYLVWVLSSDDLAYRRGSFWAVVVQFSRPDFDGHVRIPPDSEGRRSGDGKAETKHIYFLPTHLHSIRTMTQATAYRSCLVDKEGLHWLMTAAIDSGVVIRFELAVDRLVDRAAGSATTILRDRLIDHFRFHDGNAKKLKRLQHEHLASKLYGVINASDDSALTPADYFGLFCVARVNPYIDKPVAPGKPAFRPPLLCVIDDRCNFANSRYWHGNASRIHSIFLQDSEQHQLNRVDDTFRWDVAFRMQHGDIVEPTDKEAPLLVCGAIQGRKLRLKDGFPASDRQRSGRSASVASEDRSLTEPLPDEVSAYRRVAYLDPPRHSSHGAAVLSLAAGDTAWQPISDQWGISTKVQRQAIEGIRFVQLPGISVFDTSGGTLAGYVLDGIHHALEEAEPHQSVIVNLSFGTYSGPHDGTSILECALNELLDRYSGGPEVQYKTLHVVLPAGNSHLSCTHASGHLTPSRRRTLLWKVMPDDEASAFVEVWLPKHLADHVRLTVTAPNGLKINLKGPGLELSQDRSAAIIAPQQAAQSQHRRMVLVACSATQPGRTDRTAFAPAPLDPRPPGQHGVWRIELSYEGQEPEPDCPFDAWIQRSDAAPARGPSSRGYRGRQSYFVETSDDLIDPAGTLNGIATFSHCRLHVVGAMRESDGTLSPYSSAGGTPGCDRECSHRLHGPNVVVAADASLNLPGSLVTGILSGARERMSGTSMAAAIYTRELYFWLAEKGNEWTEVPFRPLESCSREAPETAGAPKRSHPLLRGECVRFKPLYHGDR